MCDDEILITDADLDYEEDVAVPGPDETKTVKKAAPKKKKASVEGGGVQKKKKSAPKLSPIVIKQRKDIVDKRIQQLLVRLNRDKALLQKYEENLLAAEAFLAEAAAVAVLVTDETTQDSIKE